LGAAAQPKKVQRSRGAGARGPAWFGWVGAGAAEGGEVLVGFGALAPLEPNRFLMAAQPVTRGWYDSAVARSFGGSAW